MVALVSEQLETNKESKILNDTEQEKENTEKSIDPNLILIGKL